MYQRVKAYVEEQHMLGEKGQSNCRRIGRCRIPYACFLCLQSFGMNDKKAEMEHWKLRRCMYITGLRGDSADADERYVRKICDAWNVPLVVYHKNIKRTCKMLEYV